MLLPALPITFCEYTTEKKIYGKYFMSLQFYLGVLQILCSQSIMF